MSDLGRHPPQYWAFGSATEAGRRVPTGHLNHKAGIVIRAGGEIGFEIGPLLPLQFKLGLECEGFANTWLIRGYTPAGILQPTAMVVLLVLRGWTEHARSGQSRRVASP